MTTFLFKTTITQFSTNFVAKMLDRRRFSILLSAVAGATLGSCSVASASAKFAGKTINYIVSTKAGGGYDIMGRLVARYLQKNLPGSEVRVSNVAGGSHVIGALAIFGAAPDGLTIGTFNTGLIYAQLLGDLKKPLDLNRFSWIGKAAAEPRVIVTGSSTPFKTVADLRSAGRPVRFASSGLKSASHYETLMLAKALDFPVEVIPGFEGREAELSIMRGEIDGLLASASALAPFVKNGYGRAVVQVGGSGTAMPQAASLADGEKAQALISLIETQSHLARLTAGPPDMEPEALETLRTAYMAMFEDPDFTAEASRLDLPLAPLSGKDVASTIARTLDMPTEIIADLKKILQA